MTAEIAALRGKKQGEDVQSPSRFPELNTKEDLKDMVAMLRSRSDGRPIGIKIADGQDRAGSGVLCLCGTGFYHR